MLKGLDLGDELIPRHTGPMDKQKGVNQWLESIKVALLSKQ